MQSYMIIALVLSCIPWTAFGEEDVQLKLAKLWGRIDELEIKIQRQEEKIRILEKGLMLGVIPEELLRGKLNLESEKKPPMDWNDSSAGTDKKVSFQKMDDAKSSSSVSKMKTASGKYDNLEYSDLVKRAQDYFGSGKYGQAITVYQKIESKYPKENSEGQSSYWIGLSWFYLKEYDLSEKSFSRLMDVSPDGPWIPRASFYMAKILVKRGLHEQAVRHFRKLIAAYPNSDTSEMARHEIEMIKERL